jgi:hypothetical protein
MGHWGGGFEEISDASMIAITITYHAGVLRHTLV